MRKFDTLREDTYSEWYMKQAIQQTVFVVLVTLGIIKPVEVSLEISG